MSFKLTKYGKSASLDTQLEKLQEQMEQIHFSLKYIEQEIRTLKHPPKSNTSSVSENELPAFRKNTIYERYNFINFKKEPLYEQVAQSLALVEILDLYQLKVTKIVTNFMLPYIDDWQGENGMNRVIDILVLCHSKLYNYKVAIVIKCLENQEKQELETFESSENLDIIEQYITSVLPEYHILYGLALGEKRVKAPEIEIYPNHYFYLNVTKEGKITEPIRTTIFDFVKKSPIDNVLSFIPNPSLLQRGISFENLEAILEKRGCKILTTKIRTLIKRKNKVAVIDGLIYTQNNFSQKNILFVVKIVSHLRLFSVYQFKSQITFYTKEIKKQFSKQKKLFRQYKIVPIILYRTVSQPYVFEILEENLVLPIQYDITTKQLKEPDYITSFF